MPVCIRGEGIPGEQFYGCGDQMACGADDDGQLFNVIAHLPRRLDQTHGAVCASAQGDNRPSRQR